MNNRQWKQRPPTVKHPILTTKQAQSIQKQRLPPMWQGQPTPRLRDRLIVRVLQTIANAPSQTLFYREAAAAERNLLATVPSATKGCAAITTVLCFGYILAALALWGGTPTPPICWRQAPICATFRNCWDTKAAKPGKYTPT